MIKLSQKCNFLYWNINSLEINAVIASRQSLVFSKIDLFFSVKLQCYFKIFKIVHDIQCQIYHWQWIIINIRTWILSLCHSFLSLLLKLIKEKQVIMYINMYLCIHRDSSYYPLICILTIHFIICYEGNVRMCVVLC